MPGADDMCDHSHHADGVIILDLPQTLYYEHPKRTAQPPGQSRVTSVLQVPFDSGGIWSLLTGI